jgi:hypothetical protein|tara:strand:+ start:873 stop:1061 length:189 start_codon:yes stop_codon:yes gene_type:complete
MYRVKIYRDEEMIGSFIEDLMSRAVDRAKKFGKRNDDVYVYEVIQTADGLFDELRCVLKTTL